MQAFYGDYPGQYGYQRTANGLQPLGRIDLWEDRNIGNKDLNKLRKWFRKFKNSVPADETWRGQVHKGDYYKDLFGEDRYSKIMLVKSSL